MPDRADSEIVRTAAERIKQLAREKGQVLVAIDGRCAAGKTTLAGQLQTELGCGLIHIDHFFLRPEQRTKERLSQPGGNVDYERLLSEVLTPLREGKAFSYRPYDCHTQSLMEPIRVERSNIQIVEGSYSCHPALWDFYDLHIFLTTSLEEQLRRIEKRNGAAAVANFRDRWIPLEERYFEAFELQKRCELCFDT